LEVHVHPKPYPLGWVNKDVELKVCKNTFSITTNNIVEVEIDVVPLDVCGVVFGSPYMYMRDSIFTRRENQHYLIKDGNYLIKNSHKGKSKISLVSATQANKLIGSSRKFVFLLLREN
jgi:hypothetical protein